MKRPGHGEDDNVEPHSETTMAQRETSGEPFQAHGPGETAPDGIAEGAVVRGRIERVDDTTVYVDLGYGVSGSMPSAHVRSADGKLTVEIGEEVSVFVDQMPDATTALVSKEMADNLRFWDKLEAAAGTHEVFEGDIIAEVKGGLSVDIGVRAFLPASQVDVRPVDDLRALIGQRLRFNVVEFHKKRGNIVLSRRALVAQELETRRHHRLAALTEGDIVDGVVKSFAPYGAFVDIGGGIDGLLRNVDISWGRVGSPGDMLTVGQAIRVKVLKVSAETGRVGLGMKHLTPDPWEGIVEQFRVGDVVQGKVVSLTNYGAFVELRPGIEGMVHVSEMSWTRRVNHPKELLAVGDELQVAIIDIDGDDRRLALSLRQTQENPWASLAKRHPTGSRVSGPVTQITDFGIFVGIEDGIDGLVHVSDMSWTEKVTDPANRFEKGQTVEAVVLNIDGQRQRLALGIKQLTEDPWEVLARNYPRGTKVSGKVTRATDFGVFVEIEPGTEGLCHISELSIDRVERTDEVVKVGDTLEVAVLEVDRKRHRVALSAKMLIEGDTDYRSYMRDETSNNLLASALQPLADRMSADDSAVPAADDKIETN